MEIKKQEVYEVDSYQFDTLESAQLYQLLNDRLSDNHRWYVVSNDDMLFIRTFDNVINIDVKPLTDDLFVLIYHKFDSDPTITTDTILDYHKKGIRFEFNRYVKSLLMQSNLENIVKNLNILFEETRHF